MLLYSLQIISVLNYLYKRNITYKDVKPSNIMISKDKKNVKFIDVIGIF